MTKVNRQMKSHPANIVWKGLGVVRVHDIPPVRGAGRKIAQRKRTVGLGAGHNSILPFRLPNSSKLPPPVAPIIDGDQTGFLRGSMGVEIKQGTSVCMSIDRHPPTSVSDPGLGVLCSV
jgi:hypothetical protein